MDEPGKLCYNEADPAASGSAISLSEVDLMHNPLILVVEDDAMVRNLIITALKTHDYPCITAANAIAYILVAVIGGYLTVKGALGVGAVVTVLLYSRQFSSPLEQIAGGFGDLQHAKAAARRVFKLYDMAEEENAEETDALTRKDYDFLKKISPNTLTILHGYAEPAIRDCEAGTSFQFVRVGYFCKDPDSTNALPVFNRTVELNGMKL